MAKATRSQVYTAIDSERDYQDAKWGGREHDDSETLGDFLIYIREYLGKADAAYTATPHADGLGSTLENVRKVTALGVAAMEVFGAPRREGF